MAESQEITPQAKHAAILSIGTANPSSCVYQTDFPDRYFRLTGSEHMVDLKSKFKRICEKSMIRKRYMGHIMTEDLPKEIEAGSNLLGEKYPTLDSRLDVDTVEIPKLGALAATKAIDEWGQPKSSITHLVFHSTSGMVMPGCDFQLVKLLGLNPSTKRCMLYYNGCMAGGTALRIAKDIAESNVGARVLVVCSEILLNGLHQPSPNNLVAHAVFGEGAGALIVGANPNTLIGERTLFEIVATDQTIVPDSESCVTSQIRDVGLIADLAREVPATIAKHIDKLMTKVVSPLGISTDWDQLFWVLHPGGAAIVQGIEDKLELKQEKLRATRHVLREYGNMSSPTVFFVLDEMRNDSIAKGLATIGEGLEWGILLSFGPGLTVETLVLRVPINT